MKYLLIHGSWHGSWCWQRLVPFLEKNGHEVECIDFPGYEQTGPSEVTYQDYYKHLEYEIVKHKEPITLVAHSMSGIFAGPLADRLDRLVEHTFFIAAFLPQFGESLLDVALRYDGSEIPKILDIDSTNKIHTVDKVEAKDVFYHDCSADIKEWASKQLRPQPYVPLETPLDWKDSLKTCDKRTYIICENDRDVSVLAQRDMAKLHPSRIINLQSGHFPFLSQPDELAKILTFEREL